MCDVSVLMATYNSEAFIIEVVDSILLQAFKGFELIIVDDGSSDSTIEIIQSYDDHRIKLFQFDHNRLETLNKGIDLSQGKYIVRMDHDDVMLPGRIQKQVDFMESNPNVAVCGSWIELFGSETGVIKTSANHEDIISNMVHSCQMAHPSTIIRKSILDAHDIRYRDGYSFADDYKMWCDIIKVGCFANIQEVLLKYRRSPAQLSATRYDELQEGTRHVKNELIDYYLSIIKLGAGGFRLKNFLRLREAYLNGEAGEETYYNEAYSLFDGLIERKLLNFGYE